MNNEWPQIANWLGSIGYGVYIPQFEKAGYDSWEILNDLTVNHLKDDGVKKGHAINIIKRIKSKALHVQNGNAPNQSQQLTVSGGAHNQNFIGDNNRPKYKYNNNNNYKRQQSQPTVKTSDPFPSIQAILQTSLGSLFAIKIIYGLLGQYRVGVDDIRQLSQFIKMGRLDEFGKELALCLRKRRSIGLCNYFWHCIKTHKQMNYAQYTDWFGSMSGHSVTLGEFSRAVSAKKYNSQQVAMIALLCDTGLYQVVEGIDSVCLQGKTLSNIKDIANNIGKTYINISEIEQLKYELIVFLTFIVVISSY